MIKSTILLITIILASGCAIQSLSKEKLSTAAVIRSGSTNIWSLTSGGSIVSLVSIDEEPVEKKYGPVYVDSGYHIVRMACGSNENEFEITVKPGDIYEFTIGSGWQPGCLGGLLKVN